MEKDGALVESEEPTRIIEIEVNISNTQSQNSIGILIR